MSHKLNVPTSELMDTGSFDKLVSPLVVPTQVIDYGQADDRELFEDFTTSFRELTGMEKNGECVSKRHQLGQIAIILEAGAATGNDPQLYDYDYFEFGLRIANGQHVAGIALQEGVNFSAKAERFLAPGGKQTRFSTSLNFMREVPRLSSLAASLGITKVSSEYPRHNIDTVKSTELHTNNEINRRGFGVGIATLKALKAYSKLF